MPGKLTLVLGLAGSGKSHFIEMHLSGCDGLFDDNFARDELFDQHYNALLTLLRAGKHCVLSELKFLDPANRDPFIAGIRQAIPDVQIEAFCFKNNPELANRNCQLRLNKPDDPQGIIHINNNNEASKVYTCPEGAVLLDIYVFPPPPRPPVPIQTPANVLALTGRLRLNDQNMHAFAKFMKLNADVFARRFGGRLFNGSVNVFVSEPRSLADQLDARQPTPTVTIPSAEMLNNSLGNGHGWACSLRSSKLTRDIPCWIFRRVGSRVDRGIIELLAAEELVKPNHFEHNDPVTILVPRNTG